MLYCSTSALTYLSVPAFYVFKNISNVFTALGDWHWFGQTLSLGIIGSIVLMIAGSLVAGLNDLQFSAVGYTWVTLQSVFMAAYVLMIKKVQKETKLSEFEQAFYNNILAIPTFAMIAYANNELSDVWLNPDVYR